MVDQIRPTFTIPTFQRSDVRRLSDLYQGGFSHPCVIANSYLSSWPVASSDRRRE